MYEDGYENITNIDISHTCVNFMSERIKERCKNMKYKYGNVCEMSEFKSGEFNCVLDKGTLDSVLCGDNSEPNAEKMLSEIHRVLAPNGVFICVTYGDEENRKKYFVSFFLFVFLLFFSRKNLIGKLRLIK